MDKIKESNKQTEIEYFDILTPEGILTGETASRDYVHKNGLWHRSVHVWIYDERSKQILLQKRSLDKESYPGLLDVSSSGHVDAREDIIAAAIRETKEEVGILLNEKDLEFVNEQIQRTIDFENEFFTNEFNYIYLAQGEFDQGIIHFDREEIESVMWVSLEEMDNLFLNHLDDLSINWNEWSKIKEILNHN